MNDVESSHGLRRGLFLMSLAIVAVAVAFLEFALVPTGIWRDEATSYFESALPTIRTVIERVRISEINPPLFFLMLHGWIAIAGRSAFTLRMFPYITSLLSLVVLFFLARRSNRRYGALVALAFVGANVLIVETASELRPYALATLLVSASALALERFLSTQNWRTLAIVAVANVALIYTTYTGSIAIVALALAGAILGRTRNAKVAIAVFAGVVPLLCALPLVPLEHVQSASNLVAPSNPHVRPGDVFSFVSRAIPDFTYEPRKSGIAFGFGLAAILAFGIFRYGRRRGAHDPDTALALAAGVFLLTALGEAAVGLETPRYIASVAPLGALALGLIAYRAICALRVRSAVAANVVLLFAIVLPLLFQCVIIERVARLPKTSLEAIAKAFPTAGTESTALIVAPDFSAQTLAFYEGSTKHVYGFARWDRPDLFDLRGYDVLWKSPGLVESALARIADLKRTGVSQLVLVRLEPKYTGLDVTSDKYRLTDALLAALTKRYGAPQRTLYPAQVEDSTANLYRL